MLLTKSPPASQPNEEQSFDKDTTTSSTTTFTKQEAQEDTQGQQTEEQHSTKVKNTGTTTFTSSLQTVEPYQQGRPFLEQSPDKDKTTSSTTATVPLEFLRWTRPSSGHKKGFELLLAKVRAMGTEFAEFLHLAGPRPLPLVAGHLAFHGTPPMSYWHSTLLVRHLLNAGYLEVSNAGEVGPGTLSALDASRGSA